MIEIDEAVAKAAMDDCRKFVDSGSFEAFRDATMNASPSGEHGSESTALIAHGRLLALRDLFDLMKRTARPAKKVKQKPDEGRRGGIDPDLDDGRQTDED